MVDVSEKDITSRIAVARGTIHMRTETLALILDDKIEKGDVFSVARVAGIMAAKKTSELIPMCHPLNITSVEIDLTPAKNPARVEIEATRARQRKNRRRDGSHDRCGGGRVDDLRHVQSRRSRDVHRRNPPGQKERRQKRNVYQKRIGPSRAEAKLPMARSFRLILCCCIIFKKRPRSPDPPGPSLDIFRRHRAKSKATREAVGVADVFDSEKTLDRSRSLQSQIANPRSPPNLAKGRNRSATSFPPSVPSLSHSQKQFCPE